jgi:GNAT superfamily N-acetyltransferase
MPRQEVNRSGEMEVFVRAVELGGFSLAGRTMRMTPSAVSKLVARLERRLGARSLDPQTAAHRRRSGISGTSAPRSGRPGRGRTSGHRRSRPARIGAGQLQRPFRSAPPAISDGFLVVYYPHLLVLPEYHGHGVGTALMQLLKNRYQNFHQHILVAEGRAVKFYEKLGFVRAGKTEPMWIYAGNDH